MGAVSLTWAVFLYVSPQYRVIALSAVVAVPLQRNLLRNHDPARHAVGDRASLHPGYNPYLHFLYMRNAYHFYSPHPGPASVLVFYMQDGNRHRSGDRRAAVQQQHGSCCRNARRT